jgi:hypothetical protein
MFYLNEADGYQALPDNNHPVMLYSGIEPAADLTTAFWLFSDNLLPS